MKLRKGSHESSDFTINFKFLCSSFIVIVFVNQLPLPLPLPQAWSTSGADQSSPTGLIGG